MLGLLSLRLQAFLSEGWVSVRPSAWQPMSITSVKVFFGQSQPRPPVGLSYWITGAEYFSQIVKLYPLQKILQADLVFGGDTAHPADHSSVIALQVMEIRSWGPGFTCKKHGAPNTQIVNSSSWCDEKRAGGEDRPQWDLASDDGTEFTTATS